MNVPLFDKKRRQCILCLLHSLLNSNMNTLVAGDSSHARPEQYATSHVLWQLSTPAVQEQDSLVATVFETLWKQIVEGERQQGELLWIHACHHARINLVLYQNFTQHQLQGPQGFITVSYTHLDVYKRQGWTGT